MLRRVLTSSSRLPAVVFLAAGMVIAGCGGSGSEQLDVVVALEMPDSVPLGEPLRVRYTFTPSEDFVAPAEDYQIFFHAVDGQGTILFQDDHYPTEPTSQWAAGQELTYSRWLYPPETLELDQIDFRVGLYSPDGRALVRAPGNTWTDSIDAHTLEVRIDDISGMPVFMDGWHAPEFTESGDRSWRWSEGVAHVVFTNPRRDGVLHVSAHGPFDEVGSQLWVFRIGEAEVGRIEITQAAEFAERIEIPAALMGDEDWVELTLEVTPAYAPKEADPASADDRVLGVQLFRLYLSSS